MDIYSQPKYGDFSRYTYTPNMPGIVTGNPLIDMVLSSALGGKGVAPVPGAGQSVYDSYLTRERSRMVLQQMQYGFANQQIVQKLGGINTQSTLGNIASMILGRPDGIMDSSIMRAFNGGNPVKAMMGLSAGMTGQTSALAFGSASNATANQIQSVFQAAQRQLFEQKTYGLDDFQGVANYQQKNITKFLNRNKAAGNFFGEFMGEQGFDFSSFKQKAQEYAEKARDSADKAIVDAYDKVFASSQAINEAEQKVGQNIISRVNAKTMRGFQFDDLTASFTMAQDLGLAFDGDTRFNKDSRLTSSNAARLSADYFSNSGRVLRAVSDLTGSQDARTAMTELNSMLGNSNLNMADSSQAQEAENLLRRFKGAARAAGVSVEAVMGILGTTKALMSQHSALKYQGGIEAMESTINSLGTGTAMMAAMGPDWVRRNGGAMNVQQQLVETSVYNQNEPVTRQMAAWASAINQSTLLTASQKEAALSRLSATAGSSASFSPAGVANTVNWLSNTLGVSQNMLLAMGESSVGQQAGMEFLTERRRLGKGLDIENAAENANLQELIQLLTVAGLGDNFKVSKADGSMMSLSERIDAFVNDIGVGERLQPTLQKYGLDRSPEVNRWLNGDTEESRAVIRNLERAAIKQNPIYQRERQFASASISAYAEDSAMMAEKMAKLQSPLFDTLAQEFISGNFANGIDGLKDIFLTEPSQQRAMSIIEAARTLSSERTLGAFKSSYLELRGGTDEASVDKNLAMMGLSDTEIALMKKQRGFMTDDGLLNMQSLSEQGLSLNQIIEAGKNWDTSKAKSLGISRSSITSAVNFLNGTGIGDKTMLSKYGNDRFTDAFQNMTSMESVSLVADMASKDVIRGIQNNKDQQFESYIKDLQTDKTGDEAQFNGERQAMAESLLTALEKLKLVSHNDIGGISDIDTAGAMAALSTGSLLDSMSFEDLESQLAAKSLHGSTSQKLLDAGVLTKDGTNLVASRSGYDALKDKEEAAKMLRRSTILREGAMEIDSAVQSNATQQDKIQGGVNPEVFSRLDASINTGSTGLIKAITSLNEILKSISR